MRKSQIFTKVKFKMGVALRVFTLLLICIPTLSFALGLGEVSLKSNLGEPLIAKIAVSDAIGALELNCFSVSDVSDTPAFKKVNIALQNINGNYLLNINTHDAVTEPIINLHVAFNCEPNLNREYVILLDPAPLVISQDNATATSQQTAASNMPLMNDKSHNRKFKQQVDQQSVAESSLVNEINKDKRKKNAFKKKFDPKLNTEASSDMKLLEAYTGKQAVENSMKPVSKNKVERQPAAEQGLASKPRLILSNIGRNSAEGAKIPSLSLRLETQIDFARVETTAPLNSTDASDEVTMMTNRLAHLEKQIVNLQVQNDRLRNEAIKTKNANSSPEQWIDWLPSLPVTLAILAALHGTFWLRRKILSKRLLNEHTSWFDTEHNNDSDNSTLNSSAAIFDNIDPTQSTSRQSSNGNISNQSQNDPFSYPNAYSVDDNDISESVLDHSDVFIAHGRPAMAIQLLQNHLLDAPVESPEIWLKLLSLLATEGTETEYDNAVIACKQFFNIKLPSFADASIVDTSTIEDYPHILARLQDIWGSEFAVEFLNDLIFNRQSQPREGFGRSTFEELFLLSQIAISLHSSSKFNKRSDIKKSTDIQPAIEIASVEQIMQDYGMSVEIEPQDNDHSPKNTINILDDELTAESFFNAPDAADDDLDISFNTEVEQPQEPPLDFGLDMSFDSEDKSDLESKFNNSELNQHLNSPSLKINTPLDADEIDFSGFLDEINIEASTNISSPQATPPEIEFDMSSNTFEDGDQDLIAGITKDHTQDNSNDEPITSLNMIEWELPTIEQELEPELESKPKTKTKKSTTT